MKTTCALIISVAALFSVACTEDDPNPYVPIYHGDGTGGDTRIGDHDNSDANHGDAHQGDAHHGDANQGDTHHGDANGGDSSELGFAIRVPQLRTVPCDGASESFWDVDYVCQIDNSTLDVEVYFQATPNGCVNALVPRPTLTTQAWVKTATGVQQTTGNYDWGGNHHVEALHFLLDGTLYGIWHSSMVFGGRVCAPPDCLRVCQSGATVDTCGVYDTFATDGCTRESGGPPPPLPVICVPVAANGSVPPFLDPWQAQVSDPSFPLLPCPGDLGP